MAGKLISGDNVNIMPEAFLQLSITLGIAVLLSLLMKLLRQPLIIGYILTGVIVGPLVSGIISEKETLEAFSHIGVALLLFIVGLGLKPKLIREVGPIALITGLGQIVFTAIGGFFLGKLLGLSDLTAGYLAMAFTLSSTIIILQLLYSKNEQDSLYGRISIGFMLVQDLASMVMFIVISSSASFGSGNFVNVLGFLILKMLLIAVALYLLMKYIIPRVDKIFAKNNEMLFVFALGICFIFTTVFYKAGFSLELGALAAGVILATSPYQREIAMRLQSLRDFFLIIFFIVMGAKIELSAVNEYWGMIIGFSLFILIGNTFIMYVIMRLLKYTAQTSFFAGLTVAQISEFSLILVGLGINMGHLDARLLGPVTLVGLITIAISSYFITYNHQIFKFLQPFLLLWKEKRFIKSDKTEKIQDIRVLLLGCHVTGGGLIRQFNREKINFIAIDHDPQVATKLAKQGLPVIYGSAEDSDLLDSLPLKKVALVISTVPDYDANEFLIKYFKTHFPKTKVICVTAHYSDALRLYSAGAVYVLMPPYLGRRFVNDLFKRNKFNIKKYQIEKERHLSDYQYIEDKLI